MCCLFICTSSTSATPDSLWKDGKKYFNLDQECYQKKGFQLIKEAADMDHYEACYDLARILIIPGHLSIKVRDSVLDSNRWTPYMTSNPGPNYGETARYLAKEYFTKALEAGSDTEVYNKAKEELDRMEDKEKAAKRAQESRKEVQAKVREEKIERAKKSAEEDSRQREYEATPKGKLLKSIDSTLSHQAYGIPNYGGTRY